MRRAGRRAEPVGPALAVLEDRRDVRVAGLAAVPAARLVRGERFVTEIESIFEELDYSEFTTNKKFVVCEGSRVVGEGRILATSPPTKEE